MRKRGGSKPKPLSENPLLAKHGVTNTFVDRFWKYVRKTESCWLWTGYTIKGYGAISKGRCGAGSMLAPRASWLIHRGDIPNGMYVLHNCPSGDNPLCLNPDHLWLGTIAQNNADMHKKGRNRTTAGMLQGESNPSNKLTTAQVLKIRQMCSNGSHHSDVAKQFGVDGSCIWLIANRKKWTHI